MRVSDFLNEELVDYASYSTLRAIPSAIDGQKNATRKVIYGAQKELKKETKVSVFAGIVSIETQYLHGDISGSIVTLARDFCGSNNVPLLVASGNFGSRMIPENSATRYIFTDKQPYFDKIFKKDDDDVLIHQVFEGDKIEPRFYVPTIPLLLVNGSVGLATGFASKILPRSVENVVSYIKAHLNNETPNKDVLNPKVNGFKGDIIVDSKHPEKGVVFGKAKIINSQKKCVEISELPLGYSLRSYIEFLDKLEEKGTIKKYEDLSDDDNFKFIVYVDTKFLSQTEAQIYEKLGLVKPYTENFTVLDAENKVLELSSAKEVIDYYIQVKLEYTEKRRLNIIQKRMKQLGELKSVLEFIQSVLDNRIDLRKDNKEALVSFCNSNDLIVTKEDSYDYLFKISILNFTPNKVLELKKSIEVVEADIQKLNDTSATEIWLKDIDELMKDLSEDDF